MALGFEEILVIIVAALILFGVGAAWKWIKFYRKAKYELAKPYDPKEEEEKKE